MERAAGQAPAGRDDPQRTAAAKTPERTSAPSCVEAGRAQYRSSSHRADNLRGMAPIGVELEADGRQPTGKHFAEPARAEALLATDPVQAEGACECRRDGFITRERISSMARRSRNWGETRQPCVNSPVHAISTPCRGVPPARRKRSRAMPRTAPSLATWSRVRGCSWWRDRLGMMDDHVHVSAARRCSHARSLRRWRSCPSHCVQPDALASLPPWETYAERLGRSAYSDYVAAHHMRKLLKWISWRNNEPGGSDSSALPRSIGGDEPLDRAAVERWHDPALHGLTEPLEFVTAFIAWSARLRRCCRHVSCCAERRRAGFVVALGAHLALDCVPATLARRTNTRGSGAVCRGDSMG
jgi:hypothetical protein